MAIPTESGPGNDVRFTLPEEAFRLGEAIAREGGRPLLVGGWVRDCLLGNPHSKDFDIEVFGMAPAKLKAVLGRFGAVHAVGRHFGVLKLVQHGLEFDVSVPRRESKTGKGHKGFWVVPDPHMSFEDAAARRDFTINAMGYEFLERRFLDPFRGLEDLRGRVLRHVGPAFGEDPLRVFRAMQFAGRFGLHIAPETLAICRGQDLAELPKERIWEEVKKLMLRAPRPSEGWAYAQPLGVLEMLPELAALRRLEPQHPISGAAADSPLRPPAGPWSRALAVVDAAAQVTERDADERLQLTLAALCHELGRTQPGLEAATFDAALAQAAVAPAQALLARLTNQPDLSKGVSALLLELPAVEALYAARAAVTDGAIRRLSLRVSISFLLHLATARCRVVHALPAHQPCQAAQWLEERASALGVLTGPPDPLLKGRHLLEAGLHPGPHMGDLLREAFELQLDGELRTVEDALDWLQRAHPELRRPRRHGDGR
jgi:tRNA nucleotidyltransferase (CCA-adding enzyme)